MIDTSSFIIGYLFSIIIDVMIFILNKNNTVSDEKSSHDNIYEVIKRSKYPEKKYDFIIYPPIISKESIWIPLGNKLSKNESIVIKEIPFDKYYTIRFDGVNFSTNMKKLRQLGIFEKGYSKKFESIMVETTNQIMKEIPNAIMAFTQSDEITVLVSKCKNDSIPYKNRRFVKYLSIFASKVTTIFNKLLFQQMIKDYNTHLLEQIPLLSFDSRIGIYDSFDDALELILWRSYDCHVNGVSSGVILNNLNISKAREMNTTEKLDILYEKGILTEMTPHQLYGTIFFLQEIKINNINKITGKTTISYKKIPFPLNIQLINLVKDSTLQYDEKTNIIKINNLIN